MTFYVQGIRGPTVLYHYLLFIDSGEDMDGQDMVSAADYSTHSGSDGHPGGDFSDVIRGDESIEISDEETDSEDEEGAELLEDGCNSAGEEVSRHTFKDGWILIAPLSINIRTPIRHHPNI